MVNIIFICKKWQQKIGFGPFGLYLCSISHKCIWAPHCTPPLFLSQAANQPPCSPDCTHNCVTTVLLECATKNVNRFPTCLHHIFLASRKNISIYIAHTLQSFYNIKHFKVKMKSVLKQARRTLATTASGASTLPGSRFLYSLGDMPTCWRNVKAPVLCTTLTVYSENI